MSTFIYYDSSIIYVKSANYVRDTMHPVHCILNALQSLDGLFCVTSIWANPSGCDVKI